VLQQSSDNEQEDDQRDNVKISKPTKSIVVTEDKEGAKDV